MPFLPVTDLKRIKLKVQASNRINGSELSVNVYRQTRFRTGSGFPASAYISSLRSTLRRQPLHQKFQLSGSISLHGICPVSLPGKLTRYRGLPQSTTQQAYHMGMRSKTVARSTLANANEKRDWRIFADFAQSLIQVARPLYADEDLGLQLDSTVYALDSTTIDLCLSVFPWARFRQTKAAVKLHTLLDLQGNIPTFIHISDGKLHDVNVLDLLLPEPGAFYVMDRGYLDNERLYQIHQASAFLLFVQNAIFNFEDCILMAWTNPRD